MKDNKLEVGDVVFTSGRWSGWTKHVIDKLTPKMAKAGGTSFINEVRTGKNYNNKEESTVKLYGEYGVGYLPTDELNKQFADQNTLIKAERLYRDFRFNSKDVEEAKKIIAFFESLKPTV